MNEHLMALRAGSLSFNNFEAATRRDWTLLARYLTRKWPLPAGVDDEDVRQELLLGCWQVLPNFDPSRGVSVQRYCVFNAIDRAKRWIHKQRAAKSRRDKSPSRHALVFSTLTEYQTQSIDYALCVQPVQERVAECKSRYGAVVDGCESERDEVCIVAFVEAKGNIDGAVSLLYDDADTRRVHRFGCREEARRAIWRAASRVV